MTKFVREKPRVINILKSRMMFNFCNVGCLSSMSRRRCCTDEDGAVSVIWVNLDRETGKIFEIGKMRTMAKSARKPGKIIRK